MILPKLIIDEDKIERIARANHIKELYIFGSALGTALSDDSDIDLMVVFESGYSLSYLDLCAIRDEFESLFQRRVDLIEKAGIINPFRQQEILSTAVRLYAA